MTFTTENNQKRTQGDFRMPKLKLEAKWLQDAKEALEGKTINLVRFMTDEEMEMMNWNTRPIILQLDDMNVIYPASDEEGNNGGVLLTNLDDMPVIPSM